MAMARVTAIAFNGNGVFPENSPYIVQAYKKDVPSFFVQCLNCHEKSTQCKACPESKGSCQSCFLIRLECLFPLPPYLHQKREFSPFQCNCIHCTISHWRCRFDSNIHPQKCQQCIKLGIPCNFKLSAQWRHNDIKLHPPPLQVSSHVAIEPVNEMNNDSVSRISDPGRRFSITNKSVHYHNWSGICPNNGYSCHGCVEQVNSQENESTVPVPSWIHVFSKSTKSSFCQNELPLLVIWRNPPPKKYVIIVIGAQRGSTEAEPTTDRSSCSCPCPKPFSHQPWCWEGYLSFWQRGFRQSSY